MSASLSAGVTGSSLVGFLNASRGSYGSVCICVRIVAKVLPVCSHGVGHDVGMGLLCVVAGAFGLGLAVSLFCATSGR